MSKAGRSKLIYAPIVFDYTSKSSAILTIPLPQIVRLRDAIYHTPGALDKSDYKLSQNVSELINRSEAEYTGAP